METPEPEYEYTPRPIFCVGDKVVRSSLDFSFRGVISQVITPDEFEANLERIRETNPNEEVEKALEWYAIRDESYRERPMYIMIPDGYDRPATFDQAKAIVPGLTRVQYDRIMQPRYFLVLESDIIPLEWLEPENEKDKEN